MSSHSRLAGALRVSIPPERPFPLPGRRRAPDDGEGVDEGADCASLDGSVFMEDEEEEEEVRRLREAAPDVDSDFEAEFAELIGPQARSPPSAFPAPPSIRFPLKSSSPRVLLAHVALTLILSDSMQPEAVSGGPCALHPVTTSAMHAGTHRTASGRPAFASAARHGGGRGG